MSTPRKWITSAFLLGLGIYLLTFEPLRFMRNHDTFQSWVDQLIYLSGAISLCLMLLCIFSSFRSHLVDRKLAGMDKAYGVHKWAAIACLATLLTHWTIDEGISYLPEGTLPAAPGDTGDSDVFTWTTSEILHQTGIETGSWSFYIFLILASIALIRVLPYGFFRLTHKLFPLIFIGGSIHALTIAPTAWWATPGAWVIALVAVSGMGMAVFVLIKGAGRQNRAAGVVSRARFAEDSNTLDVSIKMDRPFSYRPGQFAFVTFDPKEGAHPFTIADAEAGNGATPQTLRFLIKALGDYTTRLKTEIDVGQRVVVEGPYGAFDPAQTPGRQVWIAAGVGVTPFLAYLRDLKSRNEKVKAPVDLWYCTRTEHDTAFPERLDVLCRAAGVTLRKIVSRTCKRLEATDIKETLGSLDDVSVWFCGPVAFRKTLETDLERLGLEQDAFHYERFEMR